LIPLVRRIDWAGWIAALLGLLFVGSLFQYSYIDGDTRWLFDDSQALASCLRRAPWGHCTGGGKFPLLQLLSSVPAAALGASSDQTCILLARINTVAFLGTLLVCWRFLATRSRIVAWTVLLVLLSGELVHYATHSTGEMLSAFFITAFVAAWLAERRLPLFFCGVLAALSKETAAPCLALLALACAVGHHPPGTRPREVLRLERVRLLIAGAALAVGVSLNLSLNELRFSHIYNPIYAAESHWGPAMGRRAEIALALWCSPSGGWLFFWPLLVAFLMCVPYALRRRPRASTRWDPLSYAIALALLAALTVFLSGWWAPFGWWAWGQRLMLPWLPALLLILAFAYAAELDAVFRPLARSRGRVAAAVAVVALLSAPHVASLYRGMELIGETFNPSRGFEPTEPAYHRWLERALWAEPSPLGRAYLLVPGPLVRGRILLWWPLLAWIGLALYRTALRGPGGSRFEGTPQEPLGDLTGGAVGRPEGRVQPS
jgi:hypothetical protein